MVALLFPILTGRARLYLEAPMFLSTCWLTNLFCHVLDSVCRPFTGWIFDKWCSIVQTRPPRIPERPVTGQYPLTPEQRDNKKQAFISSIDKDAVCALASRHNSLKPCSIVRSASGSFNACFFVEFDDNTQWVVRIPIEPVIYNVWAKLLSEVATMQYIQSKTAIPIPHIHAYGRGEQLIRGSRATQSYLILDSIPGRPLDVQALAHETTNRRKHFYSQLIDVLAQLRQLEFTMAGSLTPNPHGGSNPIVGELLSIPINELQTSHGSPGPLSPLVSATDFALRQHHIMSEAYRIPTSELSHETAQLEVFALDHLKQLIPQMTDAHWDDGPFILTHTDLRCTNIIIDDNLNIRSIIDWEWACIVPRQFYMPPSWITGRDLLRVDGVNYEQRFLEFQGVLKAMAESSRVYRQLADEWHPSLLTALVLPLTEILQHHSNLIRVYYKFIYPRFFHEPRTEVVTQFFRSTEELALEVKWRIDTSKCYTQHLKDNGLFIPDEEVQADREWLRKAQELEKRLGINKS
ncbi:hypothetical protein FZEAL_10262 [Fusarium zealandicum]|uniref:Aminoglycoside phosphotransferase domain-containing protein n=1 Tax=Fusarium zealandicum TaxID=1053134 RepID=A0A8H4U409_9HYPO|nr:hypothetical protein FZEAL_10262 [Fusarium zealandicum]